MWMIATLRLYGEMAARDVSLADLIKRRMLALAEIPGIGTPLTEAAAAGPIGRSGNCSGNHIETLALVADLWHRVHQSFSVGMMRGGEEPLDLRFLHDFSRVHHDHSRRRLGDDAEIVGDHQDGAVEI